MGQQLQTCTSVIIGLLLAVAPLRTAHSAPPPRASAAATPVELLLDTSVLDSELGARLDRELGDQLTPALADAGLQLVEAGSPDGLDLRLRFLAFDEDIRDYRMELEVSGPDAPAQVEGFDCTACSERRLIDKIVDVASKLVAQYDAAKAELESRRPLWNPPPAVEQVPTRWSPGLLGITGLALGGAGLASSIGGIYLLSRQPKTPAGAELANGTNDSINDLRGTGGVLLGLGVSALGAGITLLIFDLRPPRFLRGLSAQASRDYFGLSFHQRF